MSVPVSARCTYSRSRRCGTHRHRTGQHCCLHTAGRDRTRPVVWAPIQVFVGQSGFARAQTRTRQLPFRSGPHTGTAIIVSFRHPQGHGNRFVQAQAPTGARQSPFRSGPHTGTAITVSFRHPQGHGNRFVQAQAPTGARPSRSARAQAPTGARQSHFVQAQAPSRARQPRFVQAQVSTQARKN